MSLNRRIARLEGTSKRQRDQRKPTFGEWWASVTGEPEYRQYRTMFEFCEALESQKELLRDNDEPAAKD